MTKNTCSPNISSPDFGEYMNEAIEICKTKPKEAIRMATELYEMEKDHLNEEEIASYHYTLGFAFHQMNKIDDTFHNLGKALKFYGQSKNYERITYIKNVLGLYYAWQGSFDKSIEFHLSALELIKKHQLQDDLLKEKTYTALGIAFGKLNRGKESTQYFEKALELSVGERRLTIISNLAAISNNSGNTKKALEYLLKTYELRNIAPLTTQVYIVSNTFMILSKHNCFKEAIDILPEIERLKTVLQEKFLYLYCSSLINVYLMCLENVEEKTAQELIQQINHVEIIEDLKKVTEELEDISRQINSYTLISKYYKYLKNWKLASNFQIRLIELTAQKYETEKMETIEQLHIQHKVAQKEQQIKIQELELEKKAIELQKKKELEQLNLQLEEKVTKRTAKLNHQNQQLREFAFIISHDLQTPLKHIHSISNVLTQVRQIEVHKDVHTFLTQIEGSAGRMNRLMKALLTYTTLEQTMKKSFKEELDSSNIVKSVLDTLQTQIDEQETTISIGTLPSLKTSKYALHIVFEQLLSNALKFKSTERSCMLQINCTESANFYKFAVRDNGEGIAEIHQERIFRPFRRLKRESDGGTGMGLAVSKKILQILGGEIYVVSEVGKGSTFYFTLPKCPKE
ncbi:MAG: ATP-binding protein [Chitinophagales bacterium]